MKKYMDTQTNHENLNDWTGSDSDTDAGQKDSGIIVVGRASILSLLSLTLPSSNKNLTHREMKQKKDISINPHRWKLHIFYINRSKCQPHES